MLWDQPMSESDLLRFLDTARTELLGHTRALGLHAPVDRITDLGGQIDAFDAHVDDLEEAARIAEETFTPLSDMRSTARYRSRVVGNLVRRLSAELTHGAAHVTDIGATLPEAAE